MPRCIICLLLVFSFCGVQAHGPTKCVGTIVVTSDSLTADIRFGIGLLHTYIDPNDDAIVSDDEFSSGMPVLRNMFIKESIVTAAGKQNFPTQCTITLTDGAEIKVVMPFDPVNQADKPVFSLPFLKRLVSVPPVIISVWEGDIGVSAPAPLFFSQDLPLDTSKRFQN